jgi:hypothetical protein
MVQRLHFRIVLWHRETVGQNRCMIQYREFKLSKIQIHPPNKSRQHYTVVLAKNVKFRRVLRLAYGPSSTTPYGDWARRL